VTSSRRERVKFMSRTNLRTLYDFQRVGVEKFVEVRAALNADDMGLGKTVQAIALDKIKREKTESDERLLTLAIAPLSVLDVWETHFRNWNPKLRVYTIDSKSRKTFEYNIKRAAAGKSEYDAFICHWTALRLVESLWKVQWFHVIADEVHMAKNRKAQQTVGLKKLHTKNKLGLSGTPADNRPDDLWSILNWLYPNTFSSFWKFYNHHVIIKHHDEIGSCGCSNGHRRPYREVVGTAHTEELHKKIAPFYIRRLKEDVLDDLPNKYYDRITVELPLQQRRAYNEMAESMLAWVGEQQDQPLAAPIVVAQLIRLQQFACAYAEVVQIKKKQRQLDGSWKTIWVNVVRLTEPSVKLDAVVQILENNPNNPLVVFAQSKQLIKMLGHRLSAKGISVGLLTGDTPQNQRGPLEKNFQKGEIQVFAGTIKAGGQGITLTRASRVVFLDRVWSPSINRQAEDRLHRIGQKSAVQITDIVARGTVDLGRMQQIRRKWSWIKEILGDPKNVQDKFLGFEDSELEGNHG
jgi:SNF2 family DNA or RNA helicase